MSEVHEAAATGFDAGAPAYARARPGYPDAIFDAVVGLIPVGDEPVLDLAAGTGKFTAGLVERGLNVIAVEPVAGMRIELNRSLPGVPLVGATAERIPLCSASVRAVTVAQAFHWFAIEATANELARILVRGGSLAVVANARDERSAWVAELSAITGTFDSALRIPRARDRHWTPLVEGSHRFEFVGALEVEHVQRLTPDGLVERVASTSWIARLEPEPQTEVLDRVRALIATHEGLRDREEIWFPYVCELQILRRT